MSTAFVLSGGASLGATQAGMLRALYERDIRPDLLVGTSAGALNAAFAATRPPTVAVAAELESVWRGLRSWTVFPANPLTAALGLAGLRSHAVPSSSLRRVVRRHLQVQRLEDAVIPVHVVAADVLTGEEVLLSEGPAVESVLASAAIPGVFAPVDIDGRLLMDGGVMNNTPISHAVALGADRVIVLPAIGDRPLSVPPRGALAAAVTGMSRAICRRLAEDIVRYAGVAEVVVLPAPRDVAILPTDFGHADALIAAGYDGARRVLAQRLRVVRAARAA